MSPASPSAGGSASPAPSLASARSYRPRYELARTVFIVGFMGAGKTTLSRRLARVCGCASIDLDRYIERYCDCRISEVFELQGEAYFRMLEEDCLRRVAAGTPAFVACGGGVVETPENIVTMREHGFVLHLKVSAEEAASRISRHSSRPLLADLDAAKLRAKLREPLYESAADATIDTAGLLKHELSRLAERKLRRAGVLVDAGAGPCGG